MIKVNNKGFTLIELLVTIALLGIIISISFISINSVIEKSKIRDCEHIIDSVRSATSEYVSDNRYGTITDYLTAQDLIDMDYLNGDIVNPFTKEAITPSSITINIVLNDDYTLKKATVNGLSCEG